MPNDNASDSSFLYGLLNRTSQKEKAALLMIEKHLSLYPDTFLSWSGGKDSTAALFLAKEVMSDIPVVFFDSGIEYPENQQYIEELANKEGINLHTINTGDTLGLLIENAWFDHYRDARDVGFTLREVKIEMPSHKAHDLYGRGRIWGLRSDESNIRSALLRPTKGITEYLSGEVACAPLWDWNEGEVRGILSKKNIPTNPIYKRLTEIGVPIKEQRVGALFDGGLDFGRITWLKRGYPHLYDKIKESLPRIEEYR